MLLLRRTRSTRVGCGIDHDSGAFGQSSVFNSSTCTRAIDLWVRAGASARPCTCPYRVVTVGGVVEIPLKRAVHIRGERLRVCNARARAMDAQRMWTHACRTVR